MEWLLYIILFFVIAFIALYILYIVLTYIGLLSIVITGNNFRVVEHGIEIYSKINRNKRLIRWEEISYGKEPFEPPFNLPMLILNDGEIVRLQMADRAILQEELEKNGKPYKISINPNDDI